jgi:ABC-type polysaccharide/polyol phosphate export permease
MRNAAGLRPSVLEEARDVAAFSHLLANLVRRDLTVRYKRSVLGFFWTMLNPLLLMIILSVVFSTVFRFAVKHFEVYFLSAYLGWTFFAQTTTGAMSSLAWNGALMKRVRVPKVIFAFSTVLSGLANLGLSCVPLFAIMFIVGAPLTPALLFLPVSFLILAVFVFGVSLGMSAAAVYFDDVAQMYGVALMGLMYLTPIFYPIEIIPQKYLWLIRLNPLVYLFELARAPIYKGCMPSLHDVVISAACAVVAMVVGTTVFRRLAPGFYRHL